MGVLNKIIYIVHCGIKGFDGFPHVAFLQRGRGPGAVVKAACLESRRSRVQTLLWYSHFNKQNISYPLTSKDTILWGASVTER